MTIGPSHLLRVFWRLQSALVGLAAVLVLGGCASGVRLDTTYTSENQDSRVLFLVLHYTVGDYESSLQTLTKPSSRSVSSHYLVRDEPVITYRLVDENRRAWHAGPSGWQGHRNINASSIGIEIVNAGPSKRADGSEVYAPYSSAQMDAVIALCKEIVARHHIRPDRIIGHNDIAPGRKQDPGPLFPWKRFADEGLIAWPDAAMVAAKKPLYEAQLPDARWFQDRLSDYGFNTSRSGQWDDLTRDSMISFQMKYRPAVYSGAPDAETAALLDVATHPQGMRMSKPGPAAQPYTTRW
jgi:N-acetylmuramoyl-L-alanine amidase